MLAGYDPDEPWYIGSISENCYHIHIFGHYSYGGAGIILSRGAMRLMAPTFPSCVKDMVSGEGDRTLSRCVLAHGIPFTQHMGMHQFDGIGLDYVMDNHPPLPLVSLHRWGPQLPVQLSSYMSLYPAGLAQRSYCMIKGVGRVIVAAGHSVSVWLRETGADEWLWNHLPAKPHPDAVLPFVMRDRLPADARYMVAEVVSTVDGQRKYVVTKYTGENLPEPLSQVQQIVVTEPILPKRWLHAPMHMCCSGSTSNGTLHLNLSLFRANGCRNHFVI